MHQSERLCGLAVRSRLLQVEATECAYDDWHADSINGVMSREAFLDSLYQLADLYAC